VQEVGSRTADLSLGSRKTQAGGVPGEVLHEMAIKQVPPLLRTPPLSQLSDLPGYKHTHRPKPANTNA